MIQRIQTIFMFLFIAIGIVNFLFLPSEETVFAPLLGDHVDFSPYVSLILAFVVLINLFLYKKNSPLIFESGDFAAKISSNVDQINLQLGNTDAA